MLLSVAGEIPFFIFFAAIFKKLGEKKVMLFALLLNALRYLLLALVSSEIPMLVVGLFTGFAPTVLLYVSSKYIGETLPGELRATALNVTVALTFGLPRMLAGIASGYMTESLGTEGGLLVCFGICAAGTLLYYIFGALARRKDEKLPS